MVTAARARLGLVRAPPASGTVVRAMLRRVHDPEIPTVSIVDLGLVHAMAVTPDRIGVEFLPTFVACPALEMIRSTGRPKPASASVTVERMTSSAGQATNVGRSSTRMRSGVTSTAWTSPRSTIETVGISGSCTRRRIARTNVPLARGARTGPRAGLAPPVTTSRRRRTGGPS